LSTTFLFYYQSFLFSAPLFCGAEDILALTDPFGKHYFHYFYFLFSAFIFRLLFFISAGEDPHFFFSGVLQSAGRPISCSGSRSLQNSACDSAVKSSIQAP
jgi:hypothetical protein